MRKGASGGDFRRQKWAPMRQRLPFKPPSIQRASDRWSFQTSWTPKILEVDGLELLLFKHQDPLPLADKFQVTNYEVTRF